MKKSYWKLDLKKEKELCRAVWKEGEERKKEWDGVLKLSLYLWSKSLLDSLNSRLDEYVREMEGSDMKKKKKKVRVKMTVIVVEWEDLGCGDLEKRKRMSE